MTAVVRVSWTGQSLEYWQGVLQGSQGGAAGVGAVLHRQGLPKRLADALCLEAGVTATPLAQLKKVTSLFSKRYNRQAVSMCLRIAQKRLRRFELDFLPEMLLVC